MNLSPLEQINNIVSEKQTSAQSPDALRRAAVQFEAVLLMQLTSALNSKNEGDEDALFGGDGGSGLAKQMFSEQLATTMAQSGGVGLSDLIMQKFGAVPEKPVVANKLSNALTAIKDSKENLPTVEKTDTLKLAAPDGKMLNPTQPRLASTSAVTEIKSFSPNAITSPLSSSNEIAYQMPVSGRTSSGFGNRFHPIDKRMKLHGGIDIAVPRNTPVAAAAQGVVTFAGWTKGYGNLVVIKHPDGRESRYGHLEKLLVSKDDEIFAGQKIALSGSTGKSTGPHLHFEIRENGQVVNPLKILSNVLPKNAER